nr:xanthine dehydrogenase small subunit [Microbulbifer rhizosphaerae]
MNRDLVEESAPAADTTLLRYLREIRRLCGTKEGCASGDCGACTVLLGALGEGCIHYRAVNACITPLAAANRRHLVTVEHLAEDGELHPAQREMVHCHGSQCGFCTPGFVMSLAGLHQQKLAQRETQVNRAQVCEAIAGNLCRCTGYRPIIDAGLKMVQPPDPGHRLDTPERVEQLAAIATAPSLPNYFQPRDLAELEQLLGEHPDARLIAGGTDLMLEVTQHYRSIEKMIDLSAVEELHRIDERDERIHMGAALSYRELENFFAPRSAEISRLLLRIGSRQIRNRGTLGGNIANASPVADLPPLLLSLDTDVTLRNSRGGERRLPLEVFYRGYKDTALDAGEYLARVSFDAIALNDFHRCYKVSKRFEDDISSAMAAIRFRGGERHFTEVRIAYGGMAATPVRAPAAEKILRGSATDDECALEAALAAIEEMMLPISDVRASAEYRRQLAQNLLRRAWLEFNGENETEARHA